MHNNTLSFENYCWGEIKRIVEEIFGVSSPEGLCIRLPFLSGKQPGADGLLNL